MGVKFDIKSNKFKQIAKATQADMGRALFEEATEIMADSKTNYCPVLSGTLRASGYVDPPVVGTTTSVTLGYGKSGSMAAPYAFIVHEAPPSRGQGKNKYLEKPMLKAQRGLQTRLKARIKAFNAAP